MKIDKLNKGEGLPITVVVAHKPSPLRDKFFEEYVLPSIEIQDVNEIIIMDEHNTAPVNRNKGAKNASNEFIFFSDDDIIYPANYMQNLLECLQKNPDASYAYTGYIGVVLGGSNQINHNFVIHTVPFDADRLRQNNFISTMALIKRSANPHFDKNLKRFQDYDLWLTLLEHGHTGVAMENQLFMAFMFDDGISSKDNDHDKAMKIIRKKHNLL